LIIEGYILTFLGIGPKSTLEANGIAVISDLPGVGQNLRDPISVNVAHFVSTPNAQGIVANPATEPEALRQYKEEAAGPYSSAAGYISYERLTDELRASLTDTTRAALEALPSDSPEVQFIAGTFLWTNGSAMGSLSATICNTFSRGSVAISSANVSDAPVIDLGWFSDPADGDVLVAGLKRSRQAWASEPAQSISLGAEVIPGDSVATDEQLLEFVKANANMIWHPSSTCSMGKEGDADAVVDSEARVFGVKGLRVVDISIFPFSLPGHPQASVYMIAEKIADAIKTGAE
jgi:choline dehydrogenase